MKKFRKILAVALALVMTLAMAAVVSAAPAPATTGANYGAGVSTVNGGDFSVRIGGNGNSARLMVYDGAELIYTSADRPVNNALNTLTVVREGFETLVVEVTIRGNSIIGDGTFIGGAPIANSLNGDLIVTNERNCPIWRKMLNFAVHGQDWAGNLDYIDFSVPGVGSAIGTGARVISNYFANTGLLNIHVRIDFIGGAVVRTFHEYWDGENDVIVDVYCGVCEICVPVPSATLTIILSGFDVAPHVQIRQEGLGNWNHYQPGLTDGEFSVELVGYQLEWGTLAAGEVSIRVRQNDCFIWYFFTWDGSSDYRAYISACMCDCC